MSGGRPAPESARDRSVGSSRPSRTDVALLLPALAALGVFLFWGWNGGGYAPTDWYLGGLILLAVLVTVLIAQPAGMRLPKLLVIAFILLSGFTAWSFLSMTWSDVTAVAWDGSNRTALYLVVFALFVVLPWRPAPAALWIGLFSVGVLILGVIAFVQAVHATGTRGFFIGGRMTGPVEYPNGSAGLFLMAGWPALVLASRREVPWFLRGPLLATTGVLVELALLAQSRGGVAAAVVVSLLLLVAVPGRVRAVATALVVAVAVYPASDSLLDVYRVVIVRGDAHEALVRGAHALLWSGAALLIAGLVLGYADGRFAFGETRARRLRAITGTVLVVLAALLIGVTAATKDPVQRLQADWHDFTAIPKPYGEGLGSRNSHFGSNVLSGNRYDVWRVAWQQFKRAPLLGAGADNFAVDYLRERRTEEEPRHPFSIELRTLGQTGLVGAALFGGFLAAAVASVISRRLREWNRVVICATGLIFAQWLIHGSVDILWEIPGLAAPAFAALAIAARLGREAASPATRPGRSDFWLRATLVGALVCLAGVGASFVFPWLSAGAVRTAEARWRADPTAAAASLRSARSLNPLSDQADVTAGLIASRRRNWPVMRIAFRRALRRDPRNWYSWFELAVVNGYTHHPKAAIAQLKVVKHLNPQEPTLGFVLYRINVGKPLAPSQLDRIFRIRLLGSTAPAPPRKP
jgi:O-Antigen ligase